MFKKIILAILFIAFFVSPAFCQELFKVTSVNFDTSNSMIFLTSPDNTSEPILKNIKLIKLTNPKRAYFDIDSAVLTAPPQNWYFNSGALKQVKIGQFSNSPSKIRVVMYFADNFNPQKVSFLKINNNLVIKFKDNFCKESYFQNTYAEDPKSAGDVYENLAITNEDISTVQIAVNDTKSQAVLKEIQQAFNESNAPDSHIKPVNSPKPDVVKKNLKLNTRYYVNGISAKQGGVLISGIGSVSVEKPLYLTSPARAVFDIPNANISPEFKNKEIKINDKDSFKIAQFDSHNARVVITSDELEKYVPVFSADDQSVLIVNPDKFDVKTLFSKTADAVAYYYKDINPQSDEFIIAFNSPVIHSVKRDASKITISFYNALRYNDNSFKGTIKATSLEGMKMDLLPKIGMKLTIPLKKENNVNCYLGEDARSIRIVINGPKLKVDKPKPLPAPHKTVVVVPLKSPIRTTGKGGKKVVLDAGHGGSDYGAIREGINEKDITLDVAKRVEAILQSKGISVEMTRIKDEFVSLQARTVITANKNPDLFVSIHVNSSTGTTATGVETHYYHPESLELAQVIQSTLASSVKSPDRGVQKSRFYVINHVTVPSVLVEIGFISNDRERAELVTEQRKQQTARAIADGILRYMGRIK